MTEEELSRVIARILVNLILLLCSKKIKSTKKPSKFFEERCNLE
jgi:hypothetical protein